MSRVYSCKWCSLICRTIELTRMCQLNFFFYNACSVLFCYVRIIALTRVVISKTYYTRSKLTTSPERQLSQPLFKHDSHKHGNLNSKTTHVKEPVVPMHVSRLL